MKHYYEIRKFEKDGKTTIIRMVEAEPKDAKKAFREYAEENPGIYRLCKIETIANYFTEKENEQ